MAANRVKEFRAKSGLTQAELAERAGISRTAVTAIEGERLVPSVAAALALAKSLGTSVEILFGQPEVSKTDLKWAWEPTQTSRHFWQAEVGGQQWLYPATTAPMLTPLPDGMLDNASATERTRLGASDTTRQTLVLACCDPAAGYLASEYERSTGYRLLVLHRSSRQALEMLSEGKVHLAGLHLATSNDPERNAQLARSTVGNCHLFRLAQWQEGIASLSSSRLRSARGAVKSKLRWVGREVGSGARQCLDELFGRPVTHRHLAKHHRGVVEAISSEWADAGICVQLASAEAGLDFIPIQEEAFDLCIPTEFLDDPRVQGLLAVVRSHTFRTTLASLPGYNTVTTGELRELN
jgi:molybdate-binding protein/DNA-binding XRE family transcriptional regulator